MTHLLKEEYNFLYLKTSHVTIISLYKKQNNKDNENLKTSHVTIISTYFLLSTFYLFSLIVILYHTLAIFSS